MVEVDSEKENSKKILEIAIKSEIEAQEIYKKLLDYNTSEEFREKIENLLENEKNHEGVLRKIYTDWYPGKGPTLPEDSVGIEGQGEKKSSTIDGLLEDALKDEKDAQDIYSNLGDKVEDESKARVFKHLAYMEREHYEILKDELEKLKK